MREKSHQQTKKTTRHARLILMGLSFGVLTVAVGLLLPACKRPVEKEAEKQIKKVLPGYVGPAKNYTVKVQGDSTGALLRGRLKTVHIEGNQVQVNPQLTLDKLTLDFAEISVDTRARKLSSIGQASFSCRIAAAELDKYVRVRRPDIAGLSLSLRADTMFVSAKPDALGLLGQQFGLNLPVKADVPVAVEGKLVPRTTTQLDFVPEGAKVGIVPVPRVALEYLARRLNPAVDLSAMEMPIDISRTEVRGNYLYLYGSVRPDQFINQTQ